MDRVPHDGKYQVIKMSILLTKSSPWSGVIQNPKYMGEWHLDMILLQPWNRRKLDGSTTIY